MGLRERNRRAAKHFAQETALRLFDQEGFESVTVLDIANAADMSESTLYRHFGTKEGIVLWDEHDADLDRALGSRFKNQPPLEAIRDAFIEDLGRRYDEDGGYQLRRIQFIYKTEAIHAAAIEADLINRTELSKALGYILKKPHRRAAQLLAATALVALDVAIEQWQDDNGKRPLAVIIEETFTDLQRIDELRS